MNLRHTTSIVVVFAAVFLASHPWTSVSAQGVFRRGDCDGNLRYEITDPIRLLNYLFVGVGGVPDCLDACDADDSESLDITDAILMLNFLFGGGRPPAPPTPDEGVDPKGKRLTCLNGREPPVRLEATPASLRFHDVGQSQTLAVIATSPTGELEDVRLSESTRYDSDAPNVASVDANGVVTAEGVGQATIDIEFRTVRIQVPVEVVPGADGAPVVLLTVPRDGAVVFSETVPVAGAVSDPEALLFLGDEPVANNGGLFSTTASLALGQNTIEVRAGGERGVGSARVTVTRTHPGKPQALGPDGKPLPAIPVPAMSDPDTIPPSVTILSPVAKSLLISSWVDVTVVVDDVTVEVSVNGVPAVGKGNQRSAQIHLPPGQQTIRARALDVVGNVGTAEATVTVDATAPEVTLSGSPRGSTHIVNETPFVLQGTVSPPGTPVFVNGESAQVEGESWLFLGDYPPGEHDLVVAAEVDSGGNDPAQPRRRAQTIRSLVVDTLPPRVEFTHPPEAVFDAPTGWVVNTETARIVGRLADAGGVPTPLRGPLSLTIHGISATFADETFFVDVPLSLGKNNLALRATDARGNALVRSLLVTRTGVSGPFLRAVAGDQQTVSPGAPAPLNLLVRSSNELGLPTVGVPITFEILAGSGHFGEGIRKITRASDLLGDVRMGFTVGVERGPATTVISASAFRHAQSPMIFVAHVIGDAERVLVPRGPRRIECAAGAPLPFPLEVRVLDGQRNPVGGEDVTFAVVEGEATVLGGAKTAVTTDTAGVASVVPELGPEPDQVVVIEARFGKTTPIRFSLTTRHTGPAADTTISGSVRDERGLPVVGMRVVLPGWPADREIGAITDSAGRFRIESAPVGEVLIGVEKNDEYVGAPRRISTLAGRESVLTPPLRLVDVSESSPRIEIVPVRTDSQTTGTITALSGLRFDVERGSVALGEGESATTLVLTAPNLIALPAPPPDDALPPYTFGVFPGGVRFTPAAQVELPVEQVPVGGRVQFFAYRATLARFVELPGGVVTDESLLPLPSAIGIERDGWYLAGRRGPPPSGGPSATIIGQRDFFLPEIDEVPARQESAVLGHNVYAHSGELFVDETDLTLPPIPGRRLAFRFRRRYESRHQFLGSLGHNWEHEYEDRRLFPALDGANVVRATGTGQFHEYLYDSQADRFVSPVGVFARLFVDADGFPVERTRDGLRYRYHPLGTDARAGRLESITDRNGDVMRFLRGENGRISEVRDPLGRTITYRHDSAGRIRTVTDFAGRELGFDYDPAGNMVMVTSPRIVGTSTGNDFPNGRKTRYVYSGGFADERLNHNLLQIVGAREVGTSEVPWMVATYGEDPAAPNFDRVETQIIGIGTVTLEYSSFVDGAAGAIADAAALEAFLLGAAGQTNFTDPEGRLQEVLWSGAGLPLRKRLYADAALDKIRPRDTTRRRPAPGVAPAFWDETFAWSREGLLTRHTRPRGDRIQYTYDSTAPLRHAQATLLRVEHHPAPALEGGDTAPEVTTYRTDPFFAVRLEEMPPRGHAALAAQKDARLFGSTWFVDYQEGASIESLAQQVGIREDEVTAALEHAGVRTNLGDLNGDGRTQEAIGVIVREEVPAGSVQLAVRRFFYNRFGQWTERSDADGRVVRRSYHPEVDPDGDGQVNPAPDLDLETGGYLARESLFLTGKDGGADREIATSYVYDALGHPRRRTDPGDRTHTFTFNALGELILEVGPDLLPYRRQLDYDAEGNVTRVRVENFTATDSGLPFVVIGNRWLDTEYTRSLLGKPLTIRREVREDKSSGVTFLTTTLRYDRSGRLIERIHPEPDTNEQWVYDERGGVLAHTRGVETTAAATVSWRRDESGDVVTSIDAADSDGDGQAETTTFVRDGFGRLVAVRDAVGGVRILERDVGGNVLTETQYGSPGGPPADGTAGDVLLRRRGWAYDPRGRVSTSFESRFNAYEPDDTPISEMLMEAYTWDDSNRLLTLSDFHQQEWTWEYNSAGQLVREVHPSGNERVFTYDVGGRPVREERLSYTVLAETPDVDENDPDFDSQGRFVEREVILRKFDARDRVTVMVDKNGDVWRARYNSLDRLIFLSDPLGISLNAPSDEELLPLVAHMTAQQLDNLNDHGNRTRYEYDGLGRLIEARAELRRNGQGGGAIDVANPFNSDGITTERYAWDGNSRLLAWTSDAGHRTMLTYDAAGFVVRRDLPGEKFETYERDRDGNLTALTDRAGNRFTQTFDALHRVTRREIDRATTTRGTTVQRFEYDGRSNVTLAFDNNSPDETADDSLVFLMYDSCGNVVSEQRGRFQAQSGYDPSGRVRWRRYPAGLVAERVRDVSGRLVSLRDEAQEYASYAYFGSGAWLQKSLWTGTKAAFIEHDKDGVPRKVGYDSAGDITELFYKDASGALAHAFEYGRERSGYRSYVRPLHRARGGGDVWFHDSMYRIVTFLPDVFDPRFPPVNPEEKFTFFYDGNHNFRFLEEDFVQIRVEINDENQYTKIGDDTIIYDAGGNLRSVAGKVYDYDALGRLVAVRENSVPVASYGYDAVGCEDAEEYRGRGRRERKVESAAGKKGADLVTHFHHAGGNLLEERSGTGDLLRQYVFEEADGRDRPAVVLNIEPGESARRRALLHDVDGSVTAAVDPSGVVVESVEYGVFGRVTILNSFGGPIRAPRELGRLVYGSMYYDLELSMHLHGARHFDPFLGRYLSDAPPSRWPEPFRLNGYWRPTVPGVGGEILGSGGRRRLPAHEMFRATLNPQDAVDGRLRLRDRDARRPPRWDIPAR